MTDLLPHIIGMRARGCCCQIKQVNRLLFLQGGFRPARQDKRLVRERRTIGWKRLFTAQTRDFPSGYFRTNITALKPHEILVLLFLVQIQ